MRRRDFLKILSGLGLALHLGCNSTSQKISQGLIMNANEFHRSRQFVKNRFGRIAYVERGNGPAALFVHGYPLNGFQWRGALERLSDSRRCVLPDLMGLGYSEVSEEQDLSPQTQTEMLIALLDELSIDSADLIANDSGGTIAQLLVARHPKRFRTMLLTDCDVHENSPPAALAPFIKNAREGRAADEWLAPQVADKSVARSEKGVGRVYTNPANLTDETIDYYFTPLLSSPLRK